ncbi:MAG: ADP-ribosylglycohydrolase family protein [Candidatus Marinimicrobia bacterium]|nr:ADP-ribosylglycohydrolase family protein [Candidatus Neomarinimicrobiota bacterium]
MIIRYLDYVERLEFEIVQRRDEGVDVKEAESTFLKIKKRLKIETLDSLQEEAKKVVSQLASKPIPADLMDLEPDDIKDIQEISNHKESADAKAHSLDQESLYDAILGGWLGRSGGCLLGKPIEKYHRTVIREMLESNNAWPLDNYFTQVGMPRDLLERYPWKRRWGLESLRENIQCMPEDDDLNFTMLNLHILESNGARFSSEDVGNAWLNKLPVFEVFTAERIAYQNLLNGISPPQSATHLNPFREWIGAQIRADLWGYVCPGNPKQAAEFAWRDARVTHVRTGVYGEMFFAAVVAGAFIEKDIRKLIRMGLDQIPPQSRFAAAIEYVLQLPVEEMPWEEVADLIYEKFGHYHWVHTINNAALTVATLLKGQGDYEKTITNAVMGGWDTDCNGATSGSIIGVLVGAQALPSKWIDPLKNQVRSSLGGFDNSKFSDLAKRTQSIAEGLRADQGHKSHTSLDDF